MSTQGIYRVRCDAPNCPETAVIMKITDVPAGWATVSSGDHLANWQPGAQRKAVTAGGRTRTVTDKRSRWDIMSGQFRLHLCPVHLDTFAAHTPSTEGLKGSARTAGEVVVRCSCGDFARRVPDAHRVGPRSEGPSQHSHRAWWQHLPAELQEYGTREDEES